jgi:hypothetical protein
MCYRSSMQSRWQHRNHNETSKSLAAKVIENEDIEDDEVTRAHRTDIGWGQINEAYYKDDDI